VDATTIRADIDADRVNKPNSSDKDARFGRFPNGKKLPGYKQETVADDQSRVILGISVYPANYREGTKLERLVDEVLSRLEGSPEVLCGDGAYDSGKNCASLESRGIRLVSPPQKPKSKDGRFTVEDFRYDERHDEFICPAGEKLKFVGMDTSTGYARRKYCAWRSRCRICSLKGPCTQSERRELKVSFYYKSLVRLRADSRTRSFRRFYRRRAPVIEGVFGEAKQWHGLSRAWRRGLAKMRIQCSLTAAAINLKRLAAVLCYLFGVKRHLHILINAIIEYLSTIGPKKINHMVIATK
jgi:hypothetical protein